jgi:hypothetical protein
MGIKWDVTKTISHLPEINATHVRFCDRFLTFSLTASVINLLLQQKEEARICSLRYVNFTIALLVIYAVLTLNPFSLYKGFMKRKKRRHRETERPKKKRSRVLTYEPIPDFTEYAKQKSRSSSSSS